MMLSLAFAATLWSFAIASDESSNARRESYNVWCVGNCDKDAHTASKPGAVLMGGGTDTTEAFEWQIKNANGGDFLVMRASGDDAYNEWIYNISMVAGPKLNSVRTLLFNNDKASTEPEVLQMIGNAEAIFFAGGDQSVYLDYWAGTEVQSIIQSKLGDVTVGGTSAGLAILGNWVYAADTGSIDTEAAMENPYDREIHIVPSFLTIPYLSSIITDTHFVTRDRMGRVLTFMGRIMQDENASVARGVGVDEHTALLLDVGTGDVTAVGVNTAYVCTPQHAPEVCTKDKPLTFKGVDCVRLSGKSGDVFSFKSFDASRDGHGVAYVNDIVGGHYADFPYGPGMDNKYSH